MKLAERIRTRWSTVALFAGALLAGLVLGWVAHTHWGEIGFHSVREVSPDYKLIAPFLYLETAETNQLKYAGLRSAMGRVVEDAKNSGKVSDISIYYRDLGNGQWFAINEDHTFALSSMLKVVTVMSVLHYVEQHPETLAARARLDSTGFEPTNQIYYPPAHPVVAGEVYTVEQLLWHDIVESDNNAEKALEAYVGLDELKQTFADLNLPVPPSTTSDYNTAKEYSHLFRVLYGATYLSRENSQAVLDLLTRTTYDKGLVAGVPGGTTVAHKFGENVLESENAASKTLELHDCGIVYYPHHPYFICVTTKGSNFDVLSDVIKSISEVAWKETAAISN